VVIPDSLFGRSGKLRFRLFSSTRLFALPILERLFGNSPDESRPGVYQAAEDVMGRPFAFISLIPFGSKAGGTVGDYRVGFWPSERRRTRSEAYENPEGFIEVTPENQDTFVSGAFPAFAISSPTIRETSGRNTSCFAKRWLTNSSSSSTISRRTAFASSTWS
jgi:hypothetical protein